MSKKLKLQPESRRAGYEARAIMAMVDLLGSPKSRLTEAGVLAPKTYRQLREYIDRSVRDAHESALEFLATMERIKNTGASDLDLAVLAGFVHGEAAGRLDMLTELFSFLEPRLRGLKAMEHLNLVRGLTPKEKENVRRLNEELLQEFPKNAPRFREIARRMGLKGREPKIDQVRFVIEGPRKSKPGTRGKRKLGTR